MDYRKYYEEHLKTVSEALSFLSPGDAILANHNACEPALFLSQLHNELDRLGSATLWGNFANSDYPCFSSPRLLQRALFMDAIKRRAYNSGALEYSPGNLSSFSDIVRGTAAPRVCVTAVSPMDSEGNVHVSLDLEWGNLFSGADVLVCEINGNIPIIPGDTAIPITKAACFYESDAPLPAIGMPPSSPEDLVIADYVSSLVRDGDCIQLGIGGMPNAVGEALLTKKDLGIHTEMITSCMAKLMKSGAVNNSRKNIDKGVTIGAFAMGNSELYDYLSHCDNVALRYPTYVNDPFVIAMNDNMVSINTALQVDLTGQICSESLGSRQYTGSGGAFDFAYGAYRSRGGRGIVALHSTAHGGSVSRIQPSLTPGSVVTISRNVADYVVTEYGIAPLRYCSVRQRAKNLIAICHPDFRAELTKQAHDILL